MGAIFDAAVDWLADAALYWLSAAQFAVRLHAPVPLVMVTAALALAGVPMTGPTEQTPDAEMPGKVLALVVAITMKLDW